MTLFELYYMFSRHVRKARAVDTVFNDPLAWSCTAMLQHISKTLLCIPYDTYPTLRFLAGGEVFGRACVDDSLGPLATSKSDMLAISSMAFWDGLKTRGLKTKQRSWIIARSLTMVTLGHALFHMTKLLSNSFLASPWVTRSSVCTETTCIE